MVHADAFHEKVVKARFGDVYLGSHFSKSDLIDLSLAPPNVVYHRIWP